MKRIMHTFLLMFIMGIVYFYMEGWARWASGSMIGYQVADMTQSRLSFAGWSSQWMVLVGGLCGLLIGLLNELTWRKSMPMLIQAIISVVLIIWPLELGSGVILNNVLGLGVWDYSHLPFNLLGQITLTSFPAFFCVSIFAIWLDDVLRHWIFGEVRPAPFIIYLKRLVTFKPTN